MGGFFSGQAHDDHHNLAANSMPKRPKMSWYTIVMYTNLC